MTDNLDGEGTQLVILAVGERLAWGHHDTFTRMDAERVEVLHVADGDAVVVFIANHLILYFLPTLEALLDEHLRREREGFLGLCQQFLFVVAEA